MCTIDKLLIKGVRSFSPDNTVTVDFYRPLTIIVGQNGAGKTTIIECLKQACTGELPPNTRSGQSFIQDPKIMGNTETKAQIKLRFNTPSQQPVVIIRSFQLMQKRQKLEFKALDQIVQTRDQQTHQKEALSYRCQDMDRIVPQLMGVSKAVLENVIFVHQEDSNWPLAEGQVLKKKFDDIFAATKYTKALEALRKLRLEKVQECKELKLQLENLRTHKQAAHRLRADFDQGTDRENALTAQIQELEAQLAGHSQEQAELNAQMQLWQEAQDSLAALRTKHEVLVTSTAARQEQLITAYGEEELENSLEELMAYHAELAPQLAQIIARIDELGDEINAARSRTDELKAQHAEGLRTEANLAAEVASAARTREDRDRALRNAAARPGGGGGLPNGDLADDVVSAFMAAFQQRVNAAEREQAAVRAAHQREDDQRGSKVDELTAQITGARQTARMRRKILEDNRDRADDLQRQLAAAAASHVMVQDAEAAAAEAQERLQKKQDALLSANFDAQLASIKTSLDSVQSRSQTLRQERDGLSVAAEDGARLQLLRKERNQKQSQIDMALTASRRSQLAQVLECTPEGVPHAEQLKAALEKALARKQQLLADKAAELEEAKATAAATQGSLKDRREQLTLQQQEADGLQSNLDAQMARILSGAAAESLDACTAAAETKHATQKAKLERINAYAINLDQFKKAAVERNVCEVCQRPFHGNERDAFIQIQERQAAALPGQKNKLKQAIQEAERRLAALRGLQPDAVRIAALQNTELARTRAQLARMESRLAEEGRRAEQLQHQHDALQSQIQMGQTLLKDVVWDVDRLVAEVAKLRGETSRLEAILVVPETSRSMADVDSDLTALELERDQLDRRSTDLLSRQGRAREEINRAQANLHSAKEEVMKVQVAMEKRAGLELELSRLEAASAAAEAEAREAESSAAPLEAQRERAMRERELARAAARQREGEQEALLRDLRGLHMQLQDKCRAVSSFQAAGTAERLADVRASLEDNQRRLLEQEANIKELEGELRNAERNRMQDNDTKRQIEDLLDFKRSLQEQDRLRAEIDQVQGQIGDVRSLERANARFSELQRICKELSTQRDKAQGNLEMVQEGVQRASKDLRAVVYKDIDQRYTTLLVKLKTTEMATGDLEKYHKALEKALLAFHADRMADINKSIKALWQQTYRNQDIDYIQIKADADGARSYNYRVVMHVGATELDMRGRCSAGQKVLACLIIRLALADTFCLNCGILALDEPTTNLDAENSAALADALRTLMEQRKEQTNFQLVIITHDERFAQIIGTREHAEYMWRVTKNENQQSHLTREEVYE